MKIKLAESLTEYVNKKHTQEECSGFIDGFEKACDIATSQTEAKDREIADAKIAFAIEVLEGCFINKGSAMHVMMAMSKKLLELKSLTT